MIEPQQTIELTVEYRELTDDFFICLMYGDIHIDMQIIDMNEFRRTGKYHMQVNPQKS